MGQPVRGVGVCLLNGALPPTGRESQSRPAYQVARHKAVADEPGRRAPSHRQEGAGGPRQNRPRQVSFFYLSRFISRSHYVSRRDSLLDAFLIIEN